MNRCEVSLPFHGNLVVPRIAIWVNDPISLVVLVPAKNSALADDARPFFHIDRVAFVI